MVNTQWQIPMHFQVGRWCQRIWAFINYMLGISWKEIWGKYSQHSLSGLTGCLLHFMLLSFLDWLPSFWIEQNKQINKDVIYPLKEKISLLFLFNVVQLGTLIQSQLIWIFSYFELKPFHSDLLFSQSLTKIEKLISVFVFSLQFFRRVCFLVLLVIFILNADLVNLNPTIKNYFVFFK